jgi:hypothetical protein
MKKQVLFASWAFYALTLTTSVAQEPMDYEYLKDTIIFTPDENSKILFIGDDLSEMIKYKRLDSLISFLSGDIKTARAQSAFPENAITTHYFISATGKRRLKAEDPESIQGFDIEKEKKSLELDLPVNAFYIHDLVNNYEIDIYVKDQRQIESLANENFTAGLLTLTSDKKVIKRNYRVELSKTSTGWNLTGKEKKQNDMIEVTPAFGVGMIGNQWSPVIGSDLYLTLSNKYGAPSFRAGVNFSGFTFTPENNMDFTNINFVQSYSAKVMWNSSSFYDKVRKPHWIGLSVGKYKTSKESELNNKYKFGLSCEGIGQLNFSFDVILFGNKKSLYGLTMVFPF